MHIRKHLAVLAALAASSAALPTAYQLIAQTPSLSTYYKYIRADPRLVARLNSSNLAATLLLANNAAFAQFVKNPNNAALLKEKEVLYESTLYTIIPTPVDVVPSAAPNRSPATFFHTAQDDAVFGNVTLGQLIQLQSGDSGVHALSGFSTRSDIVGSVGLADLVARSDC